MPAAKALMGRLLLAAKTAMDLRKVSRRIEVSCGLTNPAMMVPVAVKWLSKPPLRH
jgi:hypothetical protein